MPPPPEQRWQESECEGCQARACRRPCRTGGGGGGGSGGGGGGPKKRGQRTAPLHAVREPSASLPAGCKSGSICATQGSAARPPGPAELASSSPITDGSGTRARSRSLAGARAMRQVGCCQPQQVAAAGSAGGSMGGSTQLTCRKSQSTAQCATAGRTNTIIPFALWQQHAPAPLRHLYRRLLPPPQLQGQDVAASNGGRGCASYQRTAWRLCQAA